jgi:N-acetylmuramoyl-L-alanine amidase
VTRFIAAGHYGAGTGAHGFFDEGTLAITMTDLTCRYLRLMLKPRVKVPHTLDLAPEIAFVNTAAQPGDTATELHFNWAASAKTSGIMVIFRDGDAKSLALAKKVLARLDSQTLLSQYGKGIYPQSEIAKARKWPWLGWHHYIRPDVTPILVECGFVTGTFDAAWFTSLFHQNRFGYVLAKAL